MSTLSKRITIQCPYNLARGYLEESLATKAASGAADHLTLTAQLPALDLAESVTVTFATAQDPMHFEQPWHIHWTPRRAFYPEFDGELSVRADETYAIAALELKGTYRPPGGLFGKLFDAIAGRRIALTTAQTLLRRLGGEMEARYRRDEAAKKRERSA